MTLMTFSARLHAHVVADPDRPAVTCGTETLTRSQLEIVSNRLARDLIERGVERGDMVTIALPNSVDWFVAQHAVWRIGAIPQPVSARLPGREMEAIVELADSRLVLGAPVGSIDGRVSLPVGYAPTDDHAEVDLPDIDDVSLASPAWKAPTSGGSTGRPKLIVSGDPALINDADDPMFFIRANGCMVMPGPLYHNGPAVWASQALLAGSHVVMLSRFDAEATLAAIQEHRADIVYLVPTMMKRIWRLPEPTRLSFDLSSLQTVWHLAEPCPVWLKQVWIDWLGPERIFELYAGTEAQAATVITGHEWLAHPGSVGRPAPGTVKIADDNGTELGTNQMGEVWLRNPDGRVTYRYVGATARRSEGGWESLGDMGRLDVDGYLYLGDRAADMILSGGTNIYPAEVEAAIQEHPLVRSVAVFGLPDDDRGNVVHAVVEADPVELSEADLKSFIAERLVSYKIPRTIEFTDEALRDDAGKVRRAALRASRLGVADPPSRSTIAQSP
jgi:bile acid-coenzyme A ligase